jgi:hypothetical protein
MNDLPDAWQEIRDEIQRFDELLATLPDDVALGAFLLRNHRTTGGLPFAVRRKLAVAERAVDILRPALARLERVDARLRSGPGNVVGLLPRRPGAAPAQPAERPEPDHDPTPPRAA